MSSQHSTTPANKYTIDVARARFQELIGSRYSTPDETEEIALLTAYLADYAAFGFGKACSERMVGQ